MTKSEIIYLLLRLKPSQIKDLVVVYHDSSVGFLSMELFQILAEYSRFKLSLYRLRRHIKYVSVVCADDDGNIYHHIYSDEKFPVFLSLHSYLTELKKYNHVKTH